MKFDDYVNGILKEQSADQEWYDKTYGSKPPPSLQGLELQRNKLVADRAKMAKGVKGLQVALKDKLPDDALERRSDLSKKIEHFKGKLAAMDREMGNLNDKIMSHPEWLAAAKKRGLAVAEPKATGPAPEPKTVADAGRVPLGTYTISPGASVPSEPEIQKNIAKHHKAIAGDTSKSWLPSDPKTQMADLSKYTKYALPAAAAVGGLYVGKKALDWATGKKKKKKKNNEV